MRRIHTTFDLLEGHLLTAMLREHEIDAHLFDADLVRQDWFKQIAFGGYRVMVRDENANAARKLLQDYSTSRLTLEGEFEEICPHCTRAAGHDDPQPRRNVFLAIIVLAVSVDFAFLSWRPTPSEIICAVTVQILLNLTVPWFIVRYFKWRLRCASCGWRWRQAPRPYIELRRMTETSPP